MWEWGGRKTFDKNEFLDEAITVALMTCSLFVYESHLLVVARLSIKATHDSDGFGFWGNSSSPATTLQLALRRNINGDPHSHTSTR